MASFITVDRKILKWEWYQDVKVFHLFLYFLLRANWEDGRWKGIDVKRGQLITGRLKLSKDTGLSEMEIRTCLNKLKTTGEITIKATSKYSIITICKYDNYQNKYDNTNQQSIQQLNQLPTNNQPTSNQQLTTNNNSINNKEEETKAANPINENTIIGNMISVWMKINPKYQMEENNDYPALLNIAYKIAKIKGWAKGEVVNGKLDETTSSWEKISKFIRADDFYKKLELTTIDKKWTGLIQTMQAVKEGSKKDDLPKQPKIVRD